MTPEQKAEQARTAPAAEKAAASPPPTQQQAEPDAKAVSPRERDGSGDPSGARTPPEGAGAPADAREGDGKKIGIGGDLQFVLPIGDFADGSGPLIGPVLRFGYRVTPPLELTVRAGFLYGTSKSFGTEASFGVDVIPIQLGARYFFMEAQAGVYGAVEIGANLISPKAEVRGTSATGDMQPRFGSNLGVGYVISRALPIDVRAQFMLLNLLGTEGSENVLFGLGLSAGYTFQF